MDVNRILLDILVVLLAAKVAAEVADRINVPAVVGEIIAGIIIGPSVLGIVHTSEALQTLAQLGVILLLLEVGMEMDLAELRSVGRASLLVAFVGVAVPMVTGAGIGLALNMTGKEALFVGAALTATSVGITARVFGDLRALATIEAKTVLGAAVADDVLGLVILTVVTRIVSEGSVSVLGVLWVVLVAVGFVVLASLIGVRLVPPAFALLRRYSRSAGTLVAVALAFTLAVSELAHAAQLAPIVGAFVAGLALGRSSAADRVRIELAPVGHLFIPVFFLEIGIDAQVRQFARPAVLWIAAVLLVVAIIGKLVAVVGMAGSPGDRLLVGIGMIPRGEVGLIFATLGLRQHVFGEDVYAALLLVVLITTVGTPPVLRARLLAMRAGRRAPGTTPSAVPTGELVFLDPGGYVQLHSEPLPSDALRTALQAARLAREHGAGATLLEWLEAFPPGPRRFDAAARDEFFRLLAEGGPRSWRLLTTSGVLQRALPELDDAISHRLRDPLQIDPLSSLRLPRLEAVREASSELAPGPVLTSVLLASLVLDACDDASVQPVLVARRTVQRLDLGAAIEQSVAGLVSDGELLPAALRRVDALDEEAVLQLAVHLATTQQADALFFLAHATFSGDAWERDRLDSLADLVRDALAHPELVGRDASYAVERRKREAMTLVAAPAARARIEAAPREYVLTQTPADLARHAQLCEPPPQRSEVRAAVDNVDDGYRVEITARDRIGLLARTAWVLQDARCSVQQAAAVTWGDGTAVASFRVEAARPPEPAALAVALEADLDAPLVAAPLPDVTLEFDDKGSPWHTRCTATGPDVPGLLRGLATAFAVAGANVHSARILTEAETARDVFDLTDRRGAKLDEHLQERIVEVLAQGFEPRRRRFGLRRRGGAGHAQPHLAIDGT